MMHAETVVFLISIKRKARGDRVPGERGRAFARLLSEFTEQIEKPIKQSDWRRFADARQLQCRSPDVERQHDAEEVQLDALNPSDGEAETAAQ
jgi:hypothetical protein